jgi:ferredoxin
VLFRLTPEQKGNILLSAAGAEIVNRNTDVLAADTAYTVFSPGTGNIILVACDVAISAGTAIYKTQGQLSLEDSYIASGYGAAIVAQDIRLTLINCRICSESSPYGALHLAGGTIIADSSQFSNASAGMLLTLEEQFLAGFDGRGLQGNSLAIITAEKENESIVLRFPLPTAQKNFSAAGKRKAVSVLSESHCACGDSVRHDAYPSYGAQICADTGSGHCERCCYRDIARIGFCRRYNDGVCPSRQRILSAVHVLFFG